MPRQSRLLYLLLAISAAPLVVQAAPTYSIAQLTGLNSTADRPFALNNAGQVVGYTYTSDRRHTNAYISENGSTSNLHPANSNFTDSRAYGINESGAVVGEVRYQYGTRAAVFSNGNLQTLDTLGGNSGTGFAISASGEVAGVSATASGEHHAFVTRADGSLVDIGALGDSGDSAAYAINDYGAVTGEMYIDALGESRAFVYANGSLQALDSLGGRHAAGLAINNGGMVAGEATLAGDAVTHAFLYANGVMLDLGGLGGDASYAGGINEAGSVVGAANYSTRGALHAFLYSDGKLQDLNDLIDPGLGWTLRFANDINDKGQIVARGCKAVLACADLLLTPADTGGGDPSEVPEPETLTAGLAALILSALLRRRRRQR